MGEGAERRAPWAEVGREPAPSGLGRPPMGLPLRLGLETLWVGGAPPDLGGKFPPWPHPSLEEGARLRPPSPLALYIVGGREGSKI